jgi:hypothetical protein
MKNDTDFPIKLYYVVDGGLGTPDYQDARREAIVESKLSGRTVKITEYINGKPSGWTTTEKAV